MIEITVLTKVKCDICGIIEEKQIKVYFGTDMPMPHLPEGWRTIDNMTVCPKHEVIFTDRLEVVNNG
jgi:hypothetical protein